MLEVEIGQSRSSKEFGIAGDHEQGILVYGFFGIDVTNAVSLHRYYFAILYDHDGQTGYVPVLQTPLNIAVEAVGDEGGGLCQKGGGGEEPEEGDEN